MAETKHLPGLFNFRAEGEVILYYPSRRYEVTHRIFSRHWMMRPATRSIQEAPPLIVAHVRKRKTLLTMGVEIFEMRATHFFKRNNFVVKRVTSAASSNGQAASQSRGAQVVHLVRTSGISGQYTISFAEGLPLELPAFCYWFATYFLQTNLLHAEFMFDQFPFG